MKKEDVTRVLRRIFFVEIVLFVLAVGVVGGLVATGRLSFVLGGNNKLVVVDQKIDDKIVVSELRIDRDNGARILLQRFGGAPGDAVVAYTEIIPKGTYHDKTFPLKFIFDEERITKEQVFRSGESMYAVLYGVSTDGPYIEEPDGRYLLFDWFGNRVASRFILTN